MDKRFLPYATAVVSIVAMVMIVTVNQSLTGNSVNYTPPFRAVSDCSDTDVFNNNYEPGEIVLLSKDAPPLHKPDECLTENTLLQYYCRPGNGWGKIGRHCDNGCDQELGVCIK